jgi:hypothetical protein
MAAVTTSIMRNEGIRGIEMRGIEMRGIKMRDIGRRGVALATMVAVVALCTPAIVRGFDIVRFSAEEAAVREEADRGATLHAWTAIEGLEYSARQASFSGQVAWNDTPGAVRRRDELADILSVAPMSSAHWLILSSMRSVAQDPAVWVIAALSMSDVTGPNEGLVMAQRAMFVLSLWENLPSDVRESAANDLAMTWKTFTTPKLDQLRNILSAKSDKDRSDILRALERSQKFTLEELISLGL